MIWAERQRLPEGFLEEIVEARQFVEAYLANQADPKGWQNSEMRMLAMELEHDLALEEAEAGDGR